MNGRLVPHLACSALLLIACGGRSAQSGLPTAPPANQNVITAAELRSSGHYSTLYDAVRGLRPQWLRRARVTALSADRETEIQVYLDNTRFGGLEALRQISLNAVLSVRYFSPTEAEMQFGVGNLNGAIQVITSR